MNAQPNSIGVGREPFEEDELELASRPSNYSMSRVMQSVQNFAAISEALRLLGALVLLGSMSVFLLQGWNEGNDISRYLLLLSQTGLLAASGLALSHGLKETRGARVFFGLALVSIPANFTILSALLYSVLQWDGGLSTYPDFATWRILDAASTGATLGGALLVLVPITLFCFAVMARRSAAQLTFHCLLLNTLLLLPIRSSALVGLVALLGTCYALIVAGRLATSDGTLRTREGKFALATLFIPSGIIMFRSMYFYQMDSLLFAMCAMAVFAVVRFLSLSPERQARVSVGLDGLSLPVALMAAASLSDAARSWLPWEMLAPMFAGTFALMAWDVCRRTRSQSLSRFAGVAISVVTALSLVVNVMSVTSPLTALIGIAVGAAMALAGYAMHDRVALVAGCITALAGAAFGFGEIVEMIIHSSWIDLALFGAAAIVLGSLLDRHGAALKLRLGAWMTRLEAYRRNGEFPLREEPAPPA